MLSRLALKVLLFVYISFPVNSQQYEGDECSLSRESGVCSVLKDCPVVYAQLLAGNQPERLCGFSNFDPIVCCPRGTTTVTTTSPRTITSDPRRPTSIARTKCAEYSRAVYALETPPTLAGNRHRVNVSLCAVKSKKLIVGGTKADPKEFPHMTAVGFDGRSKGIVWGCGGSLVSERFVMTAAHCLYSPQWGNAFMARVGDLNLATTTDDARPQDRKIIERIKHPQYKRPLEYHDIALLKLESPVQFNAWVRPACLPTKPPSTVDKAVATGWGRVDWADDEGSNDLLKVTLNTVSQTRCNASFFSGGTDTRLNLGIVGDWQLCAGQLGKDTCQGDSGGPLAVFNEEQECMYDIIGITSLGRLCGSNSPGVYTRVYHYVPWLEKVIWS